MEVRNSLEIMSSSNHEPRRGMVLPFQPLSMTFNHISYYVDMPAVSYSNLRTFVYAIVECNINYVYYFKLIRSL